MHEATAPEVKARFEETEHNWNELRDAHCINSGVSEIDLKRKRKSMWRLLTKEERKAAKLHSHGVGGAFLFTINKIYEERECALKKASVDEIHALINTLKSGPPHFSVECDCDGCLAHSWKEVAREAMAKVAREITLESARKYPRGRSNASWRNHRPAWVRKALMECGRAHM